MAVFTTLDTLSEAWSVLDEIGLAGVLTGKEVSFEAEALLNALLKERKLQEFIAVITHSDPGSCGALTAQEAGEVIRDFFGGIAGAWKGLPGLAATVVEKEPATAKKKN